MRPFENQSLVMHCCSMQFCARIIPALLEVEKLKGLGKLVFSAVARCSSLPHQEVFSSNIWSQLIMVKKLQQIKASIDNDC